MKENLQRVKQITNSQISETFTRQYENTSPPPWNDMWALCCILPGLLCTRIGPAHGFDKNNDVFCFVFPDGQNTEVRFGELRDLIINLLEIWDNPGPVRITYDVLQLVTSLKNNKILRDLHKLFVPAMT